MGSNIRRCRYGDKLCMDCGNQIKKGEEYYYNYSSYKKKQQTYCMVCRPKHRKVKLDVEVLLNDLIEIPQFAFEIAERHGVKKQSIRNVYIEMRINGIDIRKFSLDEKLKFTIYYLTGDEERAILRIFKEYPYEIYSPIDWNMIINALGGGLPLKMRDKKVFEEIKHNRVGGIVNE